MDDANDVYIMDYDFILGMGAYESSLKRKNFFLIPKRKGGGEQSGSVEIDLNVLAYEYKQFQFHHLKKRAHPRSNNASSIVSGKFHKVKR